MLLNLSPENLDPPIPLKVSQASLNTFKLPKHLLNKNELLQNSGNLANVPNLYYLEGRTFSALIKFIDLISQFNEIISREKLNKSLPKDLQDNKNLINQALFLNRQAFFSNHHIRYNNIQNNTALSIVFGISFILGGLMSKGETYQWLSNTFLGSGIVISVISLSMIGIMIYNELQYQFYTSDKKQLTGFDDFLIELFEKPICAEIYLK